MTKTKDKKKKVNTAMAQPTAYNDDKWKARDDARTLANAEAIKRDKERMNKASKAARELLEEEQKRAAEAKATASAMGRIANKGKQS